ncbi:4'-phosphopantetheinyl transferase superfamily protein [Frondihabitans sp. VKM Ac-2883]|uniref:4'-phosphopantetheinyl transferase family protein n=1 Tax=Frondihabitans sp. VKM Ac-2883 TaxID=2783823 RepID=UPI00188A48D7|nr:4'-phosphopantetheinyl transferase superfamily protein [Frondihabitans sp. VKM Ac-2883]MBF4576125.1 4'-phosphopantetheinyl transferase superfamily protein [Frondihabitans sp. VKM Ac-2883]
MADVYVIDLDAASTPPDGASIPLDAAERERAGRFRDERDRRRYIAAHIALRELLGEARGCDLASVRILRAPCVVCLEQDHGKPFVDGGPYFNLSRSGRWALIAIADEPVGVDVEEPQDPGRLDSIRADVLAPGETTSGTPDDLLRVWVRKEAQLKASGDGLTQSMASFSVDPRVVDLVLPHGLVGAVWFTSETPATTRVRHR